MLMTEVAWCVCTTPTRSLTKIWRKSGRKAKSVGQATWS